MFLILARYCFMDRAASSSSVLGMDFLTAGTGGLKEMRIFNFSALWVGYCGYTKKDLKSFDN